MRIKKKFSGYWMVVNGRGRISGRRWVRTQGVRRILNQMVPVELVTPDCGVKLMVFAKGWSMWLWEEG